MKKLFIFLLLVFSLSLSIAIGGNNISPVIVANAEEITTTNVTQLQNLFNSIPNKADWNVLYIDTTDLAYWYNSAEKIIENPEGYNQDHVNDVYKGLDTAYSQLKKHITSFQLSLKSVTLTVKSSTTLHYQALPLDGMDVITWSSSDPAVVSVDQNGVITANSYSTKVITISATVNGITQKCSVTVTNPLDKIELNSTNKTLYVTQTFTIVPKAIAKDGSTQTTDPVIYDFHSNNEFVCSVNEKGVVTAKERGGAYIVITARCGSKTITEFVTIEVKDLIGITGFVPQFTVVGGAIQLVAGESETISVKITPANATIPVLKWTSSNTEIVKINSSGSASNISTAKFTALKEGSAKLTYKATDGTGVSGSVTIKVSPKITDIKLSTTKKVIPVGGVLNLTATITPQNAGNQVLDYTTTDSNVCSVDKNGRITAKANGTCNITVKTTDGSNISKVCSIRVTALAKNITLDKTYDDIETGEKITLIPTVTTTIGSTYKDFVSWASSDKTLATVSSSGVVTGIAPGTVTITATTLDGTKLFAECKIKVIARVTGVSLPTSKSLSFKESVTLKPTFTPSNATNKKVTFTSSDETIATVSDNGVVTAKSVAGTCVITCKTADGSFKAKCTIKVAMPTSSIKVSASSKTIKAGATYSLVATVSPSNATDKTVKWTSSNTKVAKVDSNGLVTAVAGGSCTITAKASGGQTATCTINVTQALTSISFAKTSYSMYKGQKLNYSVVKNPTTATTTAFTWSTSNTSIATVDNTGKVTAVGVGTCKLTCKAEGKTATCEITVKKKVACQGIEINYSEISLASGKTKTLSAIFTPSNTSVKTVKWTSSNTAIATVSSTGVVTAIKTGSCKITVTTTDGSYTDSCVVKVNVPVTGLRIVNDSQTVTIGESKTIICNVYPTNASNKTLVWSSSKKDIATVNSKGLVTGLKQGTTTITAQTPDGKFIATCTLKVCIEVKSIKVAKTSIKMQKGDSVAISYSISPSNATNQKVTWKVTDKSVISLQDGVITALKTGSADVKITTKDGGYTATVHVTVIQPVQRVVLQYSSLTLSVGVSKTVSQYVQPNYATNTKVKWSSSDKNIATVSQSGKITAVKAGTCDITCASADGFARSKIKLTVTQPVKSVTFEKTSYKVGRGKTYILQAIIKPGNATNKHLNWSTNNPEIATVDSNGVVSGLKVGSCTIMAKTDSGQFTASAKIIVFEPVTKITLNKTVISIQTTKKTTITPTIKPSNATYKDVIWSSNNLDVATVDANGVVTAKGPGFATITAKTKQGGLKATCSINVIQPVTGIKISKTSIELDVDEIASLKATISPKNASNPSVVWSTSNSKVVKVDRATGTITGVGLGSATITVKSNDGGYLATCNVTVLNKVHEVIMSSKKLTLYIDSTSKLTATVSPSNATNKKLIWYSSDQSICLVSSTGKVTPVKVGTATIYAKSEQGGIIGKCVVTVERKATSITLSAPTNTINVGEKLTIAATVNPSSTTNKTVSWKSSDSTIATVNSKGVVTAVDIGTVEITATVNGDVTKTFVLNVV